MQNFTQAWKAQGISIKVIKTLYQAKRQSSNKLYDTYIARWKGFCAEKQILSPFHTSVNNILEFLQHLLDLGLGYSAINTARSALSSVVNVTESVSVGSLPIVSMFMKAVHNLRPPVPRYVKIWDLQEVLDYLKKLGPARKLSLEVLSMKLCMLMLVASGQRPQLLPNLDTRNMNISKNSIVFTISHTDIKQGRLGFKPEPVKFVSFPADKRICVYHYLCSYLHRTLKLRGKETKLLITSKKLFCCIS